MRNPSFFLRKNISSLFLFFLISCVIAFIIPACNPVIALGRNPKGSDLEKIEKLPNYKNGEFQNLYSVPSPPSLASATSRRRPRWLGMLKYFFGKEEITRPSDRMPVVITDLKKKAWQRPTVIWFGHSSFLIQSASGNILVDPNFSGYAGPFPGMVDAFKGADAYTTDHMPSIDALVISHDHYDHLDYKTVKRLKKKVKRVIVPMGVGSHFRRWGYDSTVITELNWNESVALSAKLNITATPAHHRSNRTFENRKTLWASYVIEVDGYKIYFSGDTGYSKHFQLIGLQYGPFDLAMMECGQYNPRWSQSHMFPYQSARAALDLKAATIVPVHWGKFAESTHPWNEPVNLLLASADSLGLNVSVPYIGQPYSVGDKPLRTRWWNFK